MAVSASRTDDLSILRRHHPVGSSTGYMAGSRGDWSAQVAEAWDVSRFAVELSALSESEIDGLLEYLERKPLLPFRYLSIHGPSKDRRMPEAELVDALIELSRWGHAVVMHPDTMEDIGEYRRLGRALVIENMDARKDDGRTAQELEYLFAELPEAGFCFDIAHAWSIDESMSVGDQLLDAFRFRLRHVHVSSLSSDLHHVPLREVDEGLFAPLLRRCVDVPWILEAPLRDE